MQPCFSPNIWEMKKIGHLTLLPLKFKSVCAAMGFLLIVFLIFLTIPLPIFLRNLGMLVLVSEGQFSELFG